MRGLVFILLGLLFSYQAQALQIDWRQEPISIESEWAEFLKESGPHMADSSHFLSNIGDGTVNPSKAHLHISQLKELPNTLALVFNYPLAMHFAFLRASVFIEDLESLVVGRAIRDNDGRALLKDEQIIDVASRLNGAGHDLRGKDLLHFWDVMDGLDRGQFAGSSNQAYLPLLKSGDEVREALEPYLRQNPETSLVIFSINHYKSGVAARGLAHAQYFNNQAYREAVIEYWQSMSEEDRETIRRAFSERGIRYNHDFEDLIINQFQAHINSVHGATWPVLKKMDDPHFERLRAHLLERVPGVRTLRLPQPEPHSDECAEILLAQ